jgi:predicted GIY-YIG superfamily endonuclease
MGTTTLYRYFNIDNELLYVGISKNPISRLEQHGVDKQWFDEIASITLVKYATRGDALEAERIAIEEEEPLHNKVSGTSLIKIACPNDFDPVVFNIKQNSPYLSMWSDDRVSKLMRDLWHAYASFIGIGNEVCVHQKMVAARCQMSSGAISINTKKLIDCGYLMRSLKSNCLYSIPKEMSYRGAWKDYSDIQNPKANPASDKERV